MDKNDLINELIKRGITAGVANGLINAYNEIPSFGYLTLQASTQSQKYLKQFGTAHSGYGIYIFYTSGTLDIKYIGEAASEPFSKRLSQHFNNSQGGLRIKKSASLSIINSCDVLILYGKYGKAQARDTHFDEDFLIGTFRPQLNDR